MGPRTLRVIYTPDADEEGEIQGWITGLPFRKQIATIYDQESYASISADVFLPC
jgi:hypothetical protein